MPQRALTTYERVNREADDIKRLRGIVARNAVDDEGVPMWARAAYRKSWMREDGTISTKPSALDVLTREPGLFAVHRSFSQELDALEELAGQARAWCESGNRIEQTWAEASALRDQAYFLSHFENPAVDPGEKHSRAHVFAVTFANWIRTLPAEPRIAEDGSKMEPSSKLDIFHSLPFVAHRLGCTVSRARGLVYSGERVCELRALLGHDELIVVAERERENAHAAGTLAA